MDTVLKALIEDNLTAGELEQLSLIRTADWSDGVDLGDTHILLDNFYKTASHKFDMKMRKESLKRCIERHLDSYYMNKLYNCDELHDLLPILKEIRLEEEARDDVRNAQYCFITFAPQGCSVWDVMKRIDKVIKFKWIKKYLYVCEQRFDGIPNDKYKKLGEGHHIHLLIDKGDYKPSHLKREIMGKFKDIVCNIDYSYRKPIDLFKTQKYMIGDKKDEMKQLKQVQDKIWREQEGLKEYYGELWQE